MFFACGRRISRLRRGGRMYFFWCKRSTKKTAAPLPLRKPRGMLLLLRALTSHSSPAPLRVAGTHFILLRKISGASRGFAPPSGCQINNISLHFICCMGNVNVAHVTGEMLGERSRLWLAGSRYGYYAAYPQSQSRKGFLACRGHAALVFSVWLWVLSLVENIHPYGFGFLGDWETL